MSAGATFEAGDTQIVMGPFVDADPPIAYDSSPGGIELFEYDGEGANDSFTLAVAHKEGNTAILDAVREVRPPFSPEAVVAEFADLLKKYRINTVEGDRYGGEWPREQFRNAGM